MINHAKMEEQVGSSKYTSQKTYIRQILSKLIKEAESDEMLQITDIKFTSGSKAGDNYLSNLQRATIKGIRGNGEGYFKTIILKRSLSDKDHSIFFNYTELWLNEIEVYRTVIPLLEKAVGKKLNYPKLYFGDENLIILEDLKPHGYVMVDRRTGMDLEHSKIALEEIADFHSGSIILKYGHVNDYNLIESKIGRHPFQEEKSIEGTVPLVRNAIDTAVKRLQDTGDGPNKYGQFIKYVNKLKENIHEILRDLSSDRSSIYTVAAHGDCYLNNFLFSYSEERQVNKLMLVDYQGTRLMSLLVDLHHMFYTSLQPRVRNEHLDTLLKHYYDCLNNNLRNSKVFNNDFLNPALTFEGFRREFESCHVVGLISALTILPAMTYNPENIPDISNVSKSWEKNSKNKNIEHYYTNDLTNRLKDLADEFIARDWCK